MSPTPSKPSPDTEQPFISHLVELRERLLRMVLAIALVFAVLFAFSNDIYTFVAGPIRAHLPAGVTLIATEVASPFLTPFKLALIASVFVAMPYLLYQLWAFVAPGLYQHEKRLAVPLLVSSILLFYVGMAFAYYLVLPLIFGFFAAVTPEGVTQMPDITHYLDFVLTLFFAFGAAFEIPVATVLLVAIGVTTPDDLVAKRPYIIVGAFIVGMLLTPPDVFSQTMLAVPMWLLFEAGVLASRMLLKRRTGDEGDDEPPDPPRSIAAPPPRPPAPTAPAGPPVKREAPAPEPTMVGLDISGGDPFDPERFRPLTPEEMEAELDAMDAATLPPPMPRNPVEQQLREIDRLRHLGDVTGARRLLYDVLAAGDEDQRRVARNILEQLDGH